MSAAPSLDDLDPPAWGPVPANSTTLIRRCHELRAKPLEKFTIEDLRIMIGQEINLEFLIPRALERLVSDPLVEGEFYPGDLLSNVLRVDVHFWRGSQDLAVVTQDLARGLERIAELDPDLPADLRDLIKAFARLSL